MINSPMPHRILTSRDTGAFVLGVVLVILCGLPVSLPAQRQVRDSGETSMIQGAVIIAHLEEDVDFNSSETLRPYVEQLREIFGYDVYRLEGQTIEPLRQIGQETRIQTKPISVSITWLGGKTSPTEAGEQPDPATLQAMPTAPYHRFRLEIFQKEELVVETQVEVSRNSPFYIHGPEWGRSEILFMILAGDPPLPN